MIGCELCIHCEGTGEEIKEEWKPGRAYARRPSLRHLQRNYRLPEDVDPKTVQAEITDKGVIHVTAMKAH